MSTAQTPSVNAVVVQGHGKQGDRLYHTVTACTRCRQRKTRCDPGLPRCGPCHRNHARCEYFDPTRNRLIPRTYITSLQRSLAQLEKEVQELEINERHIPDAELMVRGGASIKFSEYDESRYLGPSSGIGVTRFVMDLAKQHTASKSIREVVPQITAQDIRKKFVDESEKPTSKIYPLISSVPAQNLPSRDLLDRLVDLYMIKGQYMLPLLHEPTFRKDVDDVYNGSMDTCKNFQLRMVIANTMQMLDTQFAGLADSYYLAALPFLEASIKPMDLNALQCFVLIAQYSTLTPTRTASYWIVGLAARLSQELGLCDEETIEYAPSGLRYNTLQIDMRRRLYWIVLSMEYGLSHSLGRPSCFGIGVDHINVNYFELCDDRFIEPEGILQGAEPIMKKCISIHFFRMRLLQAEIRRMLYLKKRDYPTNDNDRWFHEMQAKLDYWIASCPKNDEGSGLSQTWFQVRVNTMIILLYRPSPQIPEPSLDAARKCYDAATTNIQFQYQQIRTKVIPVTWIFTLTLCMELNTTLWTLSYGAIRQEHPYTEVRHHIDIALDGLTLCSERWPGVLSALQLYRSLINGCLQAYKSDASYVITAPSTKASPSSTHDNSTPSAQSPSSYTSHIDSTFESASPHPRLPYQIDSAYSIPQISVVATDPASLSDQRTPYSQTSQPLSSPSSLYHQSPHAFDNANYFSPESKFSPTDMPPINTSLPSWDTEALFNAPKAVWSNPLGGIEEKTWLASFGDEYSRYMHQSIFVPPSEHIGLNQQQQSELMASLENSNQIPDVSQLVNESRTIYSRTLGNGIG